MIDNIYKPIIGLEVHVELKTKSKMFCGCSTEYFGQKPNTHACPVCLGFPGALPVPNKKAVEWCVMIGMALNCEIPLTSKFDRKNYFYPDLPKGYQISQYDSPFAIKGKITLSSGLTIRIRRVHMEEDTGKLLHAQVNGEKVSLIDFNRSGVPLVEIVTEPDFHSAKDVKEYLQTLQQIVRYLEISDADMEKGQMRLEPNISLREISNLKSQISNNQLPKYKVEVKNINSFKFVEKAIDYEIKRQSKVIKEGKAPVQETRGWDEKSGTTISQRTKEEATDYRYFPEPDIPPIKWAESQLENLKSQMPELPDAKLQRFKDTYGLASYDLEILTREKETADYFEEAVKIGKQHGISAKQISNVIINKRFNTEELSPAQLVGLIKNSSQTVTVDEEKLITIVKMVMADNPKAVEDYKKGKKNAIMFLVGQVMKQFKEKIDAKDVIKRIERKLKEI